MYVCRVALCTKNQVVATHPNMFELTPQRPAILDGTSTFQLLLWPGCVRFGNCIKVHVEAASGRGGVQVRKSTQVPKVYANLHF